MLLIMLIRRSVMLAIFGFHSGLVAAQQAELHTVAGIDKDAVCNDGSPGAYYLQHATEYPQGWVIRLMGGGWCINPEDCLNRWAQTPYLMSTKMLPSMLAPGDSVPGVPDVVLPLHGILSADPVENPHWAGYNHVYLWYCTSDSHLGDAPQGHAEGREQWSFRGKRIVRAVMDDLLRHHQLAAAEEILVTGDSAGGVGIMNNAAFIHSLLKEEAQQLSRFKMLVDAGWFLDIPSFSSRGWFTFRAAAAALKDSYNTTFDSACEAHFGDEERWRCFHAQYAWPHVPVPAFYLEFLYDSANLGFDAAAPADIEPFRDQLTDSLAEIARPGQGPAAAALQRLWQLLARFLKAGAVDDGELPSVFAPACHLHETIDSPGFRTLRIGLTPLRALLVDWFQRGTRVALVDPHPGMRPEAQCLTVPFRDHLQGSQYMVQA